MGFLQNTPYFIPRVRDGKILEYNVEAEYVIMGAGSVQAFKNVHTNLSASYGVVIMPETHRLISEKTRNTEIEALPYNIPVADIDLLFSDSSYRLENLVKPCIQFQLDNGSPIVVAPYLYFDDYRSPLFSTSVNILADTIVNKEHTAHGKPIYAVINTSPMILTNDDALSVVRSRYFDDYEDQIDGFLIAVDGLDDRTADELILRGLARLVHEIGQFKPVVVLPIGGFGEILMALGAAASSSGIAQSETFSLAALGDEAPHFGRGSNWFYVPEIFNYMDEGDLNSAGYTCDCEACGGRGVPTDSFSKKRHHILRKMALADELKPLGRADRIALMEKRLEEAKDLVREMRRTTNVGPKNVSYLDKWLNVLREAKRWSSVDDEDKEIADLISELDRENT